MEVIGNVAKLDHPGHAERISACCGHVNAASTDLTRRGRGRRLVRGVATAVWRQTMRGRSDDMAGRLEAKVALITGGGSGIGRACALRFAKEGASICVADIDLAAATETGRQVDAAGRKSLPIQVDTTDEAAADVMVKRCGEGLGAVDVLVAAAGVGGPRVPGSDSYHPYTVLKIPMEQFRRVIDVNLYGVLFSNRAVARWMTDNRRGGSIINLACLTSRWPSPRGALT